MFSSIHSFYFHLNHTYILTNNTKQNIIYQSINFIPNIDNGVNGQASLKNLFASSTPATVSATSTATFTLSFNSNLANGYISVNVPSPGSFTPSTTLSKCSVTTSSITLTACTITSNAARIDFTVASGASITTIVFKALTFINPFSTSTISGLSGSYYDSTQTLIAYSTGYTMSGFSAQVMSTTPTFTSSSDLIGATGQTLTVKFTTMGQLPSSGVIMLVFPAYTTSKEYIQSSNPNCIGTQTLKSSLSCTYVSTNHTLILTNVLSLSQTSGGVSMTFTVNNFRNPYSGIPRTGFTLYTMDQYFGSIDYSTSASITVSTFASFSNPSIERLDGITTVGEDSIIMPYFELGTLPIDASCRLRIDFPSDMPITSVLSSVSGSGLFSSVSSFYSKSSTLNYLEVNGCSFSSTEDPSDVGLIFLNTVANKGYVQQTNTFTFSLYAMSGATYYNIAQQTSSITLNDFTFGVINSFNVQPVTTYNVQESTTFVVTMQPDTDMPTSSKIVITFPSSVTLNSGSCTLSSTTGAISSSPSSCVVSANILTITNPYGSSSYSASSGSFSFTFTTGSSAGSNPISTASIGTFTVNTYAIVSSASYAIDSSTFSNLYTAVATQMTASVGTDNTIACTSGSTYTLTINNLKTIPQNGKLQIIFPTQVYLSASALTSCKVGSTTLSTSSACVVGSTSPVTINISGGFSSSQAAGSFTVQMAGLTNPSSLSTTSSFTIYTMDSSSNIIEYVSSGGTVQMTTLSPLTVFTPSLSSSTNGASGKLIISITVNCPLLTGSIVQFTAPSQIDIPSSPTCAKVSGTGLTSVSCSTSSNTVSATLKLSTTLSTGTTFSFSVSTITNPPSTCTTSGFTSIAIYDSSGNQVNAYTGTSPTVKTTTPATATGSLSQVSQIISTSNDYTITYTNIDDVPSGSTFQIGYPSIVTVPSSLTDCFVQVGGSSYGMSCSPDSSVRIIYVTSNPGITSTISSGTSIAITFGPITNPSAYTASPPSFTMTSYTDSTYSCSIDTITSGLLVQFICYSPCLTCLTTNKNYCLSCNQADSNGYYYLYSNTCVTVCPTGYYPDSSNKCQACMTQCLTCTSGTQCVTCNTAGTYPILYNNDCISSCPSGYYRPTGTYTCLQCDSTCLTCSGTSTYCLSCSSSGSYPILYSNTCVASCPSGYVNINYVCVKCTSPCLTCTILQTECVTCIGTYYLYQSSCYSTCPSTTVGITTTSPSTCIDCGSNCKTCSSTSTSTCYSCSTGYYLYDNTCVSSCPTGTYQSGNNCYDCDSTCKTCSGTNNNNCLTCYTSGTYPYFLSNTCISSCPTGYIELNNICQQCTTPCLTCSVLQTQCVTCISGYYYYQNSCYSSCPQTTVAVTTTSPASCQACGSNCKTCSATNQATCYSCSTGYYLYDNTCVSSCPTATYQSGNNCYDCDSTCKTCSGTSNNNCVTCYTSGTYPYFLSNTCITACPSGYISSNYQCVACTSPCLTCSVSQTQCTSCISTYYLYSSTCLQTCPSTTVASNAANPNSCLTCGSNCKTCSSTSTSTCYSCTTGYYLSGTSCISYCPTGYYLSSQTCLPCDSSCLTCSGSNNNNCLTCDISGSYPYSLGNLCLSTCPSGYISLNNQCTKCTSPCLTCSVTQTNCVTCVSGYYFYQNTCISSCPSTTVATTTTTPSSCISCASNCNTCSSTNTAICYSCSTGYYLYSNTCVASCPTGTYLSGSTCLSCYSTCLTCSGSNSNNCLTCDTAGTYPLQLANSCVSTCPSGYLTSGTSCLQCTSPCLTCSVLQTQCVTCISSYYLYENTCVKTCPSGTVAQTTLTPQQCTNCGSNCYSCSSTDATQCTTCDSGYVLYNGVCYKSCPTGAYLPSGSTSCSKCDNTCLTCNSASTNCTSCNQSSTYPLQLANTCVKNCPNGYVQISNQCYQCTSPCQTCSISETYCQTCISSYYLYQNTCYKKCPSGTTVSGSTCLGCTTSCASCNTNTSTCLQCSSGYYLYNGFCYKTCPGTTIPDTTSQSCIQPVISSSSSSSQSSSSSSSNISISNNSNNSNLSNSTNTTANLTDKTYAYFPIATSQTILGGITLASHFKDPTSMLHSNTLAIWAPLEFLGYASQGYQAYVQEYKRQTQYDFVHNDNKTFDDPSGVTNSSRRYLDSTDATSVSANSGLPLVLYGTIGSFIMMILTNTVWAIVHCILVNKDSGYIDHRKRHCWTPICIALCSALCSFKIARLHHARFFGLERFSVSYEKHKHVQHILNILTIVNMVLTLIPIVFVDIYGLIYHKWGNQFYISLIETLFLSLCNIFLAVFEFRHSQQVEPKSYSQITDNSGLNEESLMKKIDDQIRMKLGGQGLDEFLDKLKHKKGLTQDEYKGTLKGLGKSRSCDDLNRQLEQDDRVVNTEPLDPEKKQAYLNKPNPFAKNDIDPEYPNNCYAELGRNPKQEIPASNRRTKVIQTGQKVLEGDEYDKEYEQKLRDLIGDTRKDERQYDQMVADDKDSDMDVRRRDKSKMRGRKDRYYEQVDNEDMSFSEEAMIKLLKGDATVDLDDTQYLDRIEEGSDDQEDDLDSESDERQKELDIINQEEKESDRIKMEELERERKILEDIENEKKKQELIEEEKKLKEIENEKKKQEEMENEKKKQLEQQLLIEQEQIQAEKDKQLKQQQLEQEKAQKEQERLKLLQEQELLEQQQELENQKLIKIQEEEEKFIHSDNLNKEDQQQPDNEDIQREIVPSEEDFEEVEQEQMGEADSDDDNDSRIKNMCNPELRKFNVNDILGDFDRDKKGNLVVLSNNQGQFVDKQGNNVNEKGYLIDEKTGDVVEKEKGIKIFDKKDLDQRGEIPPPFNIERFNFNPHDVRGFFERDKESGEQIVGKLRNNQGQLVDKLGRLVNQHGYLVDSNGNIVDKRGRIRLHKKQLEENGNIPLLFNYKGRKFDIKDIIGDFDKDRKGNIIIRRDKDNQMVDKKGRKVNGKGYLIDQEGNIINDKGKLMFNSYALSQDQEIPKFFPFLKFNVEDIKGEFEMDPLGNPMLQKTADGQYLDNNGKNVNEKGYLIDKDGNIKNKRGLQVFRKTLMEEGGDIPKVFRTGLFRKDTMDSFSQLMSEIEELEKQQEEDENGGGYKSYGNKQPGKISNQEQEMIQRRIEKIVEEDNDDDDLIMKELEDLAQDGQYEDGISEGGNTSVDSKMDDTPSNYDLANQRFRDQEDMRDRVRNQLRRDDLGNEEDDMESQSEYAQLPGKKIKRRKKKPKKKKKQVAKKEPQIDENDLLMAAAYGGMPMSQVDKLMQDRKRKENALRPPINRNAANSTRQESMQQKIYPDKADDDNRSDWGEGKIIGGRVKLGMTDNAGSMLNINNQRQRSQAKRTGGGYVMDVKQNNLMNSTQNSIRNAADMQRSNKSSRARPYEQTVRDSRLNNIANSVSGFYKEQTLSEQSKLRSTHESNFASNLPQGIKKRKRNDEDDGDRQQPIYDPELERMYGAAQGLGGDGAMQVQSDWDKDSDSSGQSRFTQMTGTNNNKRIKGLESIYLQRLEPAQKNINKQQKKKKAQFRQQMQDSAYDENQWIDQYNNDQQRDELESELSDNYRQMQQKFNQGVTKMIGVSDTNRKNKSNLDEEGKPNIFHGNFYQYKEKKEKQKQQNLLDFNK